MYVVRTAIKAKTVAIKTAAVGQSMIFSSSVRRPGGASCAARAIDVICEGRIEQGHWSRALVPVVLPPSDPRWTFDSALRYRPRVTCR